MQMATLGTSTSCLVLAGDTAPQQVVLDRAKEKNVPIIVTADEVTVIVDKIEGALSQVRFNQDGKMPKLTKIMKKHFDFPTFDKGLGLSKK